MNNEMFQNIFDILQDGLPEQWNKVVFFVGYTEGSYTMKYYIKGLDNQYKDCFSLDKPGKAGLIKLFMQIDKVISKERNATEDNKWTVMTMIVDSAGAMKTEFDYENITENAIEYEREWKKTYLQ